MKKCLYVMIAVVFFAGCGKEGEYAQAERRTAEVATQERQTAGLIPYKTETVKEEEDADGNGRKDKQTEREYELSAYEKQNFNAVLDVIGGLVSKGTTKEW